MRQDRVRCCARRTSQRIEAAEWILVELLVGLGHELPSCSGELIADTDVRVSGVIRRLRPLPRHPSNRPPQALLELADLIYCAAEIYLKKGILMRTVHRRTFVKGLAVGAAGVLVSRSPASLAETRSSNERLNVAVIGCGGRGGANLASVSGENIIALCDVDEKRAAGGFAQFPRAEKFRDFRKMFDRLHKRIDAVVVSTPDHIHAPATAMALRLGKHCYCEKPLAHSVHEARVLASLAAEKKLVTQMGTQHHAGDHYRRTVELVTSGAIGPVREVHVWCGKNFTAPLRSKGPHPVPGHLDWDLWLGPAATRPYDPCYAPTTWRWRWDFANGQLGDMGCHYMDLPFWALRLRHPTSVEAEKKPAVNPETCPPTMKVRYRFPARGELPPVELTWYHGPIPPAVLREKKLPVWKRGGSGPVSGVLFVGNEGMLMADFHRKKLFPESKFVGFQPPDPTIPDSIGHHAEWIAACKHGRPTTCNFDYSGALTEAVLLGNVSFRSGKKLEWDAEKLRTNAGSEADGLLRREYREGWTL